MKSMAVNILTLYKFNGKFIWKINIKYLLYQVPSGSCIKHLSDSLGNCSEVLSVRLQPTFFRNGQTQLCMQGKHLFYLKNKEKTPPFLFLCFKIVAACCRIVPLHLTTETKSCFLEKGGECYFTAHRCIIDVEDNLKFLMQIISVHHTVELKHIAHTYHNIHLCLYECTLANTHKWVFSFWDVCFLCECLTRCPELDIVSFAISAFLRCQAALRARWTACVICVTVSTAPWQKRTCSADAVRGGQGYCEHCSASSTSTLPSSTCTSPSSASLWVVWGCVGVSMSATKSLFGGRDLQHLGT